MKKTHTNPSGGCNDAQRHQYDHWDDAAKYFRMFPETAKRFYRSITQDDAKEDEE